MKVAIFSTKYYEQEYLDKSNIKDKHDFIYFKEALNIETANLAVNFDAVCVMLLDKLDRETIVQLAKNGIKLISLRTAGFDNVDLAAAAENNIRVTRVPSYSPEAIAEHAVALVMTLNRKIHKAYNRVRENNFSIENLMGFNLYGKTVGIIGTGKIGRAFCNIMLGFGCKVIAYDIKESEILKEKGIVYKTFDEVLHQSDIISIHLPLTPSSKHLFNSIAFAKMKKGAMLVNSGRGAIIKTIDAIEVLKSGQLGYLAIDVYEGEGEIFFRDLSNSIIQDDIIERLISFNNVLVTPHLGFFTKEAVEEIAITTIKNCTDFESGVHLENEVGLN